MISYLFGVFLVFSKRLQGYILLLLVRKKKHLKWKGLAFSRGNKLWPPLEDEKSFPSAPYLGGLVWAFEQV